jgi:hypothetical protein
MKQHTNCDICLAFEEAQPIKLSGQPVNVCKRCLMVYSLMVQEVRGDFDKASAIKDKIRASIGRLDLRRYLIERKTMFNHYKHTLDDAEIVASLMGDL